jgi:UDP:flavonoid glycosyltransferase YjiC (YdhE family)
MKPKKILFANVPFDGHFNPLTGLAVHLKQIGHDVRWYTQKTYAEKIGKFGIPFYGFKRAPEVDQRDPENTFPDRRKIKSQTGKLKNYL